MIDKKTSKTIKKRMIDLDVKVTDLAKNFGISRQYVSNVLNCKLDNPRVENLILDWYKNSKKGE